MRIAIDPGHGGRDPGGGSCRFFTEKDWVLRTSLYQAELLRAQGHEVALTRTVDKAVSLAARAEYIRRFGAEICVSNHVNKVKNSAARGLELFHSIFAPPDLAQAICEAILDLKLIGPRSGLPPVRTRESTQNPGKDYYGIIRQTGKTQTVIIEYGFASSLADAEILAENWRKLADAAVHGLLRYIEARQ